jgi:AcrR family transcriptional regulator
MAKAARAERELAGQRRAIRVGRPPRERAGEVEARILDAAHRVFLQRGLGGASMDEIAEVARAGKPTIYARFPGKEALFVAVLMRSVTTTIVQFESEDPGGGTAEERLARVAATLLHWVLVSGHIGMMRLAIAEANRFPDLASAVQRMVRGRGTEAVARLLREVAQSDALGAAPAFAPERIATTTQFFIDLVVLPLVLRALYGEKTATLEAEIGPHVARTVAFFVAGCRQGGVS